MAMRDNHIEERSRKPKISQAFQRWLLILERGGFVQVGYGAERFQRDIDEFVVGLTRNRHVGENGSIIIVDEDTLAFLVAGEAEQFDDITMLCISYAGEQPAISEETV